MDEDIQAMSEEQRRELQYRSSSIEPDGAVRELEGDALIREVLGADLTAKTMPHIKGIP